MGLKWETFDDNTEPPSSTTPTTPGLSSPEWLSFRDEVATELQSFYEFLIGLHLPENALKLPPPGGWPEITPEEFAFLGKSDAVIDLLKHIPYLYVEGDSSYPGLHIYEGCVTSDYHHRNGTNRATGYSESISPDSMKGYETFSETPDGDPITQHIVSLAYSHNRNGHHMFCDTEAKVMYLADFQDGKFDAYEVKDFYGMLKEEFRTLTAYPNMKAGDVELARLTPDCCELEAIQNLIRSYGWPSADFRKEECMVALEELWHSFFR